MEKQISALEKLMHLYSPAQVAVWLELSDPRPIHQWILRGKIPRTKVIKVDELLKKKGNGDGRIIRRSKRQEKRAF